MPASIINKIIEKHEGCQGNSGRALEKPLFALQRDFWAFSEISLVLGFNLKSSLSVR